VLPEFRREDVTTVFVGDDVVEIRTLGRIGQFGADRVTGGWVRCRVERSLDRRTSNATDVISG
jgi:hypothetical protein